MNRKEKKLMQELRTHSFSEDVSIYFLIIFLVVIATTLFVS